MAPRNNGNAKAAKTTSGRANRGKTQASNTNTGRSPGKGKPTANVATSILLDTNCLQHARVYYSLVEQYNLNPVPNLDPTDKRFNKYKAAYDAITQWLDQGCTLYTTDFNLAELKSINIENEFYEYVRGHGKVPVYLLYDSRSDTLKSIRPEFNLQRLPLVISEFDQWSRTWPFAGNIRPLPSSLSGTSQQAWIVKHGHIFAILMELVTISVADAYILAGAMAEGIEELATKDTEFIQALDTLSTSPISGHLKNKLAHRLRPPLFTGSVRVPRHKRIP